MFERKADQRTEICLKFSKFESSVQDFRYLSNYLTLNRCPAIWKLCC